MKILKSFDEFLNESILSRGENRFIQSVFDNGYDTLEVSLRFAAKAQEVFKDNGMHKKGKQTSSNTYKFNDEDWFSYFLEDLIQYGIPYSELELS